MNYLLTIKWNIHHIIGSCSLLSNGDTTLLSRKVSNKIKGYKIDMKAFQELANLGSRPDVNNVTHKIKNVNV